MKTLKSVANPSHAELSVKLPSPPRPRGPQPSHQCSARSGGTFPVLAALVLLAVFSTNIARAVDFHCVTAQDLQNALTLGAANGADNSIYLANGYYVGNFNYNSTGNNALTLLPELGVTNTSITIDGAGGGRALNLTSSGTGNFSVQGITFLRNCGNSGIGALRIAAGNSATILVSGCQFLSPADTSGMGLELASGGIAVLTNCTATGANTGGGGTGISISVTGNASVQNCAVTTNNGNGISISSAIIVAVTGSIFSGNTGVGAACFGSTTTATLSSNIFSGNVGGGANISLAFYSSTTITLSGNTFNGNSGCGGAWCQGSFYTLLGNTFSGNLSNGGATCPAGWGATVSGNTFSGNVGGKAGGITCDSVSLTLSGNTFMNNFSTGGINSWGGGGAYCCNGGNGPAGLITVSGNTFSGNSANNNQGGGLYCYCAAGGNVALTSNTFTGNSCSRDGGGVCLSGDPSSINTINMNTFSGNTAGGNGGGICVSGYTAGVNFNGWSGNDAPYASTISTVSGNTFVNNSAAVGGGIYAWVQMINMTDNILAQNNSSSGGGIWANTSSNLFLINNTITANNSYGFGGGVTFQVSGVVELLNVFNNIIWGNTASGSGGDVYLTGTGQQKVFEFNDVDSMSGVWDIATSNIDLAPQFFDPVNGDYHTLSTSPCVNAGTNGALSLPLTDLDGNSRTNSAGMVDMGCYEFNTTATHPADTNGDFVITPAEYAAYAAAWKAGQSWTNAPASAPNPNPIPANYVTRAGYLMTNGGAYYNAGSARPVNWKPIGQ